MDIPEIPKSDPIVPPWERTSLKGLVVSLPPWEKHDVPEPVEKFVPPMAESEIEIEEEIISQTLSGYGEMKSRIRALNEAVRSTTITYDEAVTLMGMSY